MADTYLQYQSTKQSYTRTDPLADILENINKNPKAALFHDSKHLFV